MSSFPYTYSTSESSNPFSGLETMLPILDGGLGGGGGVSVLVFEVGEMMFWVVGGMV